MRCVKSKIQFPKTVQDVKSIGYNVIGMLKKCRTLFVHNGKKQPALHLNPHVSAIFLQFPKPANLPRSRGISTPPAELPKVMTST